MIDETLIGRCSVSIMLQIASFLGQGEFILQKTVHQYTNECYIKAIMVPLCNDCTNRYNINHSTSCEQVPPLAYSDDFGGGLRKGTNNDDKG